MQKILIRGTNWIGDTVMSLAALREIRRLYPGSELTLLARPWVVGLFPNQGLIDHILLLDHSSTLSRLFRLPVRLRQFDMAVLFQNAFEAALVVFLAGIPRRIGYHTEGRGLFLTQGGDPRIKSLHRHQVYYYLDLLYQSGLSPTNYLESPDFQPDVHLTASSAGREAARSLLEKSGADRARPLVVINPGAYYGSAKRWLIDRYALLSDRLIAEKGTEIALVGSPREVQIAREIGRLMRHSPRVLTGQTSLESLMGLLSLARLFITNDSGPMHVAAALDVPQIALFGSTDEIATGPYSARATVIHKHVDCSPCLLRECPIDLRCFTRIEVEEVFDRAEAILDGQASGFSGSRRDPHR